MLNFNIPKTLTVAAACAIVWGLWLLLPFFDVFDRPVYEAMVDAIHFGGSETAERVWGVGALLLGILPFINNKPLWLYRITHALLLAFFVVIAVNVSLVTFDAPVIGLHLVLALTTLDGIYHDRPNN